jgi:hypothetical protein
MRESERIKEFMMKEERDVRESLGEFRREERGERKKYD